MGAMRARWQLLLTPLGTQVCTKKSRKAGFSYFIASESLAAEAGDPMNDVQDIVCIMLYGSLLQMILWRKPPSHWRVRMRPMRIAVEGRQRGGKGREQSHSLIVLNVSIRGCLCSLCRFTYLMLDE